ncbi:MAG: radical SAM protein [bacterium]|nr:radical SAM protein [bacterium]
MKVLLLDLGKGNEGAASGGGLQGNLGLEYIASFIKMNGYKVVVLEPPLNIISCDEILKIAGDFDAVGMSCMTWNADTTNAFAAKIRQKNPTIRLVVGGNGPTGIPEFFTNFFDTVICGEGEIPFLDWLEKKDLRKIIPATRNLSWNGNIFPLRNKEVIDASCMRGIWPIPYSEQKVANLLYGRGCYNACTFCSSPLTWLRKIVWRKPKSVVNEILELHEKYGINSIDLVDPTFNANPTKVLDLCEAFIKNGIQNKIKWTAMVSPSVHGAQEIFPAMREAGCIKVGIGIEDPTPSERKNLRKGGNANSCRQMVELASTNDLLIRAYLIIGDDCQGEANVANIREALSSWPIDEIRISIFTPFPGTTAWLIQDKIKEKDFSKFNTNNPIIKSAWNNEQLVEIRRELTYDFYNSENYKKRRLIKIEKDCSYDIAYEQFEEKFLKPKGYI